MKIGMIGCGHIGHRRGKELGSNHLVGVTDTNPENAKALASELGCEFFLRTEDLLKTDIDVAIIAVPHRELYPTAVQALEAGKNILLEKPGAIRVSELDSLRELSEKLKLKIKVGFNHRFHPAILKAKAVCDSGKLGPLLFMRARYGHGARIGYEKEWRCQPEISGGGELLDQGVHLLDLIYWFLGPLPLQSSYLTTSFWDTPVEDNAVVTCASKDRWGTFHVSFSEWKNLFSMEIYGENGKITIDGLGRSYGKETLKVYEMLPEMGPPNQETFEFEDHENESWRLDLQNLIDHIEKGTPLLGDLNSARYALECVRGAYQANGYTHLPCSV